MPAGKNIVTLYVDGQAYSHWTDLSITMELNSCARSFSFGATLKLPGNTSLHNFRPGQKVQITIGDDLVLSGYIDAIPVSYSASSVSLTVSGRSKACGAVLDEEGFCSKPCKYGKLQKQIAELQKKIKNEQSEASNANETASA